MHLCGVCCTDEGRLSFCVCAYLFPWDVTPTTWVVLVVVQSEAYMTLEKEFLGFILFFLESQSETMTHFFLIKATLNTMCLSVYNLVSSRENLLMISLICHTFSSLIST